MVRRISRSLAALGEDLLAGRYRAVCHHAAQVFQLGSRELQGAKEGDILEAGSEALQQIVGSVARWLRKKADDRAEG